MESADVILIQPHSMFEGNKSPSKRFDVIPLGPLYIAAYLQSKGIRVKLIDALQTGMGLHDVIQRIKTIRPKIVGISAMTSTIRPAVELAKLMKKEFKNEIAIGLGGHHVSADNTIIERYPFFDFAVLGEGEITFTRLCIDILNGRKVAGVFKGEIPADLDDLPFPLIESIDYKSFKSSWTNQIQYSRGCPFKCSFCSRPGISNELRSRDPELAVEEMNKTYKYNNNPNFFFVDDSLTLHKKKSLLLFEAMSKKLQFKMKWSGMTRVNLVNEELIKLMKRSGCWQIMFGVESGSKRIRDQIIKKRITEEQIVEAFRLCRKYKIEAATFLMLGFPTETREDMYETEKFVKRIKCDMVGVHLTIPLPGSEIWQKAIEEKVIPEDLIDRYILGKLGEGFNDVWPYYIPKGLTLFEMLEIRNRIQRKFYLNTRYILFRLSKDFTSFNQLKMDVREFFSLIVRGRPKYYQE